MNIEYKNNNNMYNDPEYKEKIANLKKRLNKLVEKFSFSEKESREIQSLIDNDLKD